LLFSNIFTSTPQLEEMWADIAWVVKIFFQKSQYLEFSIFSIHNLTFRDDLSHLIEPLPSLFYWADAVLYQKNKRENFP
jgi:hypothetical protein